MSDSLDQVRLYFGYSLRGGRHTKVEIQDTLTKHRLVELFGRGPYFDVELQKRFVITFPVEGALLTMDFSEIPAGRHKCETWIEFEPVKRPIAHDFVIHDQVKMAL